MKIAMLTKYGDLAASTRQRFGQYRPFLEEAGCTLLHRPLLDDHYLGRLYADEPRDRWHVARRYIERIKWLTSSPDVDLIWLHCEAFPYLPGVAERLVNVSGKPVVFDYDDAIFHNYDLHSNKLARRFLGKKLHVTLASADAAFCGNAYLADYARPHCPRVEIIPTVVDLAVYTVRPEITAGDALTIGWIGTPSTYAEYVQPMMPLLAEAAQAAGARIIAVGAGASATGHPLLDILPWSEASEVSNIHQMSIGIMPLDDTPWARGKCGYKLIQYMACGIPVIASPVGVNADIVEHGVNGFLANTEAEWREAIRMLLHDPELRQRMGAAGRKKVEAQYSLQVWGPQVADMLLDVAKGHSQQ